MKWVNVDIMGLSTLAVNTTQCLRVITVRRNAQKRTGAGARRHSNTNQMGGAGCVCLTLSLAGGTVYEHSVEECCRGCGRR